MRPTPTAGAPGRVVNIKPTIVGCLILAAGFLIKGIYILSGSTDGGLQVVTGLTLLAGYITVRIGARSLWPSQRTMALVGAGVMLAAFIMNGSIRNQHPTDLAGFKNLLLLHILHDVLVGAAIVLTLWQIGRMGERALTIAGLVGGAVVGFILYGMFDGLNAGNLSNFETLAKVGGVIETALPAMAALLCALLLRKRLDLGLIGPARR